MNKYKVQFKEVTTTLYCIDVLAENEQEAEKKAEPILQKKFENGTYHYYETEADVTIPELSMVYDVTNTDDPFNPENNCTFNPENNCTFCNKPQDEDGRCCCTNKDSN